jgi:hypothetical protein
MFKKILFIVALTAIALQASYISLEDIEAKYEDTHGEIGILTDTDGKNDDATFFLFLEMAGFADNNSFGIYEFTKNNDGSIVIGDMLEVFSGGANPITATTLEFDLTAGTVENKSTGIKANIDETFGFYIDNDQNAGSFPYFSHTKLNSDGFDHFKTFNTSDNSLPMLLGADVVLAIEDLQGGGDEDFNDMIIGMSDIEVPEPGIISLIGLSVICFAGYRRCRK